jgi:hypothetical protein
LETNNNLIRLAFLTICRAPALSFERPNVYSEQELLEGRGESLAA